MTAFLTIAEAARRIAARQLSPVELAKTHLDRIRRLDPALNAFLVVTEERALADAKAAEARQMAGTLRGRLDGIPIAHKDITTPRESARRRIRSSLKTMFPRATRTP